MKKGIHIGPGAKNIRFNNTTIRNAETGVHIEGGHDIKFGNLNISGGKNGLVIGRQAEDVLINDLVISEQFIETVKWVTRDEIELKAKAELGTQAEQSAALEVFDGLKKGSTLERIVAGVKGNALYSSIEITTIVGTVVGWIVG